MRPEILFPLFANLSTLKGVGGATLKGFARLLKGDESAHVSVKDLLFHLPTTVVDRRFSPKLFEAPPDTVCTFEVTIEEHYPPGTGFRFASKKPYRVLCHGDGGDLMLVFFHLGKNYLEKALPIGEKRIVSGRTEIFDMRLQMVHPDYMLPLERRAEIDRVEPQYPLTANLTHHKITATMAEAVQRLPDLPEWIDAELLKKHRWPSFKAALLKLHQPDTEADIAEDSPAKTRLAFDEIFAMQLRIGMARKKLEAMSGPAFTGGGERWAEIEESLPFDLTGSQQAAMSQLDKELATGKRVVHMLQGDVGSGKTLVALFAMMRSVEAGFQAALMVPTELIAQQHKRNIEAMCREVAVTICLLTGSVKGAEREAVLADIASGKAQLIIGTHALFQEKVSYQKLGLIVIDEQHRFGVNQRMALASKGDNPHILHMSATPIPRSLMMTIYGDMHPILLTEKPAGRQPITTAVMPLAKADQLMVRMQTAIERGEKIYWICPLIEENPEQTDGFLSEDIAAAQSRYTEFKARFGAPKVGLVHGRIEAETRDGVMQAFAAGEIKILVATTVIEVGVDVPDATIMIIEKAEKFGLSQLHQLRGRVGRSDKASYCVLLYGETITEIGLERLTILRNTEDGFSIAEADLAMRGGGELMGSRQSGLPKTIFVDFYRQHDLLTLARTQADIIVQAGQDKNETNQMVMELYHA